MGTNHCFYDGFHENIHFVLQLINLQKTFITQPLEWEHSTNKLFLKQFLPLTGNA